MYFTQITLIQTFIFRCLENIRNNYKAFEKPPYSISFSIVVNTYYARSKKKVFSTMVNWTSLRIYTFR